MRLSRTHLRTSGVMRASTVLAMVRIPTNQLLTISNQSFLVSQLPRPKGRGFFVRPMGLTEFRFANDAPLTARQLG